MPFTKSRALTMIAAALMLAQGVYGIVMCWLENYWTPVLFCVAAIVSGFALASRCWWSKLLVVTLMLLVFVPGLWIGWRAVAGGLFHGHSAMEICLMLFPGLAYLGLSLFCAYVAVKYVPGR